MSRVERSSLSVAPGVGPVAATVVGDLGSVVPEGAKWVGVSCGAGMPELRLKGEIWIL